MRTNSEAEWLYDILRAVARKYEVRVPILRSRERGKAITEARHEAWRRLHGHGWSHERIAAAFGRERTTVLDGIRAAVKRRELQRIKPPVHRLPPDELAIAIEMNAAKTGLAPIGRRLHRCTKTIKASLIEAGIEPYTKAHGGNSTADEKTDLPIGEIPPGHPLYEADQAMLRARQMRHRAVGGWTQSSLADFG